MRYVIAPEAVPDTCGMMEVNRLEAATGPYLQQHADNPGRLVGVERRSSFSGREAWELLIRDLACQASVCLIGKNLDALNVEIEYDRVILHACVLEQDTETSIDLERIRGELEEMLDHVTPVPKVTRERTVGINGPEWDGYWRMSSSRGTGPRTLPSSRK